MTKVTGSKKRAKEKTKCMHMFKVSDLSFFVKLKNKISKIKITMFKGVQWLSGRVLDSRLRGCGFEPHRHHCVASLSKTH